MFKKFVLTLTITISCLFFTSCFRMPVENNGEKPEITSKYTVEDLKNGAFKGGGMIYSPESQDINQLLEGMEIPFRLSSIPANARSTRSEYEEDIKYGYLTVEKIIENQVFINFVLLYENGKVFSHGENLPLGYDTGIDFNSDGIEDVFFDSYSIYTEKSSALTEAYESFERDSEDDVFKSSILKFSDPRQNGNGCTFRLSESNYEGNSYPSGILNINPNGALVVTSLNFTPCLDFIPSATSVAFLNHDMPELQKGDFIIDIQNERFRKITEEPRYIGDMVIFESTDTTIDEAFITFDLFYEKPVTVFMDAREAAAQRLSWSHDFKKTLWTKEATTEHGTLTQTLEATGDIAVNVTLHASFHAGIKWHWWPPHPSISLSCNVGIDFDFDHHFFLDYKAVYEYFRKWEDTIFDETKTIIVEGVPINLRASGTVGLDLTANAVAEIWTGYRLHGGLSAGVGYKLGDGFSHDFSHTLSFDRYGPEAKAKGTIDLKPYFDLKLALGVAYVAWVESDTIPYLEGVVEGNAGIFLDDDYRVTPQDMWIDFNVYGGLEQDITLRLGYKWISIHKSFTLYNHKWPIWDIEFKWPRAPENFNLTPDYKKAYLSWRDMSKVETGYKIYKKKYPETDFHVLDTTGANIESYTFNGNEDATFQVKAYYHVKHLNFDMYQILAPESKILIACPELMTGIPTNGNPFLIWKDISIRNTGYEVDIEKDGEFDFEPVTTELSGDATSLLYIMPENMDSQFKSRAYYIPEGKTVADAVYSAWSNVYQWLAIPSGLAGFPYDDGEILLKWNNNSHKSQGYELWYQKYAEPSITVTLTDPSTKSHVMEKIDSVSWDMYDVLFKIRNYVYDTTLATNTYSGWSNSFQWVAAPSEFRIERVFDNNILYWRDNSHVETGYEIWKQLDSGHSYKTGITSENIEKYLDKPGPEFGSDEFAYKIRAYKDEDNVAGYSDWSGMVIHNFRDPSNLTAELTGTEDKIDISWQINSNFANKTFVYTRKNGTGDFILYGEIGEGISHTTVDNDTKENIEITVKSVFVDKNGNTQLSGYSNIVNVEYPQRTEHPAWDFSFYFFRRKPANGKRKWTLFPVNFREFTIPNKNRIFAFR